MRMRWIVVAALVGLVITGVSPTQVAAAALPADAPTTTPVASRDDPHGDPKRLVVGYPTADASAKEGGRRGQAAAGCADPNTVTRYRGCKFVTGKVLTVAMTVPPVVLGVTWFNVTHHYQLSPNSRTIHERLDVRTTRSTAKTRLSLTAGCPAPCTATTKFPGGWMRTGKTLSGTITFHDTTPTQHAFEASYRAVFSAPGTVPGLAEGISPRFRCDDLMPGQNAGCVFPDYIPTLTTLSGLRFVGPNIKKLQSQGAPTQLHRNSWLTDINREQICGPAKLPPGWKPPAGWPKPLSDKLNQPSCDEYAFASTDEGGDKPGNGYGWVPLRENNAQGGLLQGFFRQNRVLDAASIIQTGDPFNVTV
jgi:hypothetical protein